MPMPQDIDVKPVDHPSQIYFEDIDGNPFEITRYEYRV